MIFCLQTQYKSKLAIPMVIYRNQSQIFIHGSIGRLCKIFHSQPMQPTATRNRVLSRHVKQNMICLPQACSTSWRDVFQCWWIVTYPHLDKCTAWLVYLRSSGSKRMQTSIYDRWKTAASVLKEDFMRLPVWYFQALLTCWQVRATESRCEWVASQAQCDAI